MEENLIDTSHVTTLQIELRIDLTRALQKLTPEQKELCDSLKQGGSNIKEVSQCLNTPRSSIYDEIKRILKVFLKEGLEKYLKPDQPSYRISMDVRE